MGIYSSDEAIGALMHLYPAFKKVIFLKLDLHLKKPDLGLDEWAQQWEEAIENLKAEGLRICARKAMLQEGIDPKEGV